MTKRLSCLLVAILLLPLVASAHDPEPIATINITDVSMKGSPVKFWGTADAYATPMPNGSISLSVQENEVGWQNVSGKDISLLIVRVYRTGVRGESSLAFHIFKRGYPANFVASRMLAGMTNPSGRIMVNAFSRRMSSEDYNQKPYVEPTCQISAVEVTFKDGTIWTDTEKFDSLPGRVQDMIRGEQLKAEPAVQIK